MIQRRVLFTLTLPTTHYWVGYFQLRLPFSPLDRAPSRCSTVSMDKDLRSVRFFVLKTNRDV